MRPNRSRASMAPRRAENAARPADAANASLIADGIEHHRKGDLDAARAAYTRVLATDPSHFDALHLMGVVAAQIGQPDIAVRMIALALQVRPDSPEALNSLASALMALGRTETAEEALRHAAEISPGDPDVLSNLARGALKADCLDEGLDAAQEALRRGPRHSGALVNLAAIECLHGRFDEAERLCRAALALAPGLRSARHNLTIALLQMGRHEEAERMLDAMLAADYGDAEAHWNRAIGRLSRGSLKCGWAEFDWRWRLPKATPPTVPAAPEWNNAPLRGRRLWLWPEQGLGDQLVFLSMLPDLLARQAEVVVECDPRLTSLLGRSFPNARFVASAAAGADRQAAAFDYQLSLGSLARHLRPAIAAFPKRSGYLIADEDEKLRWRAWLNGFGCGRKIGISWRSHNLAGERRLACARLEQWLPVLRCAGVHFVCLQYDDCTQELADVAGRFGIRLHQPPGLDQRNDLDGVCGLLSSLDLVITAPTTVSALAGALGVPTWQLNSGIDWQGLNQPYSPWQPSVRRFYKPWNRSWDDELARVAAELELMRARSSFGRLPNRQNAAEASRPSR